MKVIKNLIIMLLIVLLVFFCGCEESNNDIKKSYNKITLKSEVVELINASLDLNYNDSNVITKAEVIYLFHNIANRIIQDLNVFIEFYDVNNNLVYTSQTKHIRNIPIDYREQSILEANSVYYDGEDVYKVHHVKIIAKEL